MPTAAAKPDSASALAPMCPLVRDPSDMPPPNGSRLSCGAGIFPRIRRHPLLGCARLILDWGTIAQGGVQPPVIVIAKIAAQREPELVVRHEPRAVHHLGLQRVKERFHVRVVARRADARGALPDAQRSQAVAECLGGILAAAIAVEDEPSRRP